MLKQALGLACEHESARSADRVSARSSKFASQLFSPLIDNRTRCMPLRCSAQAGQRVAQASCCRLMHMNVTALSMHVWLSSWGHLA